MSKYVFCDLDLTLLNDTKEISKENYTAIKDFEAKGNHFIICSGRVPFALKPYKDLLQSTEVITSNGAVILSDNQTIKNVSLSKDILTPVIDYAVKNKVNLRLFAYDFLYILNQDKAHSSSFVYKQSKMVDEKSIYNLISDNVKIIKAAFSGEKEVLDKIKKDIENLKLDIEMVFSSNTFLEINSNNQNKGNGIKDYCKLKNIDIKDTVSIGDNDNDISMLKTTGYSACPSNAIDEVKQIVDYVCINDNNHNAIKEVLEKIS